MATQELRKGQIVNRRRKYLKEMLKQMELNNGNKKLFSQYAKYERKEKEKLQRLLMKTSKVFQIHLRHIGTSLIFYFIKSA